MTSLSSSDSDWDVHLLALESQLASLRLGLHHRLYKEGETAVVTGDWITTPEAYQLFRFRVNESNFVGNPLQPH